MSTCPPVAQSPGGWSALTSMPGWFKKAWYGLASLLSFSSFLLIIVALAVPHWLSGKILCQTGVDLVNATDPELVKFIGDIYYGLFRGCKVRQCGLGGRLSQFTSEYIGACEHIRAHKLLCEFFALQECLCLNEIWLLPIQDITLKSIGHQQLLWSKAKRFFSFFSKKDKQK